MNHFIPNDFTQVEKAIFDDALAKNNWRREGWSNGEVYKFFADGKEFAFHDQENETFWVWKDLLTSYVSKWLRPQPSDPPYYSTK